MTWHPKKKQTPETALKRACTQLLKYYGIRTWPIVAGPLSPPGLPDRFGITSEGKPLALEFKSRHGRLNASQEQFRREWESAGGVFIEVREIEDLKEGLNLPCLF